MTVSKKTACCTDAVSVAHRTRSKTPPGAFFQSALPTLPCQSMLHDALND